MSPVRTATAFAVTVSLFYALCALVWLVAPGPFLGFMNALFHGLDFSQLLRPGPFALSSFLYALAVLGGWAWCAAAFFVWLSNRLAR